MDGQAMNNYVLWGCSELPTTSQFQPWARPVIVFTINRLSDFSSPNEGVEGGQSGDPNSSL
jgi:hypothetical protein